MNDMLQKAKNVCKLVNEMEILILTKRYDKIYNLADKSYMVFHDKGDKFSGYKFRYDYDFKNSNAIQILNNKIDIFFNPRGSKLIYINYDTDGDDQYDLDMPVLKDLIEEDKFFQNSLVQDYILQELYIIMAYLKENCKICFNFQLNDLQNMMTLLEIKNG